ncbi:MAG: nucleotide exchange factor GrpE [Crocinitomicaceae bacterium]
MARKNKDKENLEEEVVNNDAAETHDSEEPTVDAEPVELTAEEKLEELNNKYLRLYSDFDNFRKRSIKEKADIISSASSDLMNTLLPILDDFDRAIANNEKSEDLNGLKEGFELIYNKALNSLKAKGLEPIDVKGEVFDAEVHEAITNIPAPSEDMKGKIVDVIEKGYNLKGKSLRFPKVVVGQ